MFKLFRRKKQRAETVVLREPVPAALVDCHCHCLPELDDGPGTMASAVALCETLAREGVRVVIATPHQLGHFAEVSVEMIRHRVDYLQETLKAKGIEITVMPGAEVRVAETVVDLVRAGEVLTLGDLGKHLLLELPYETFVDVRYVVTELAEMGIQTIIAHPERHDALLVNPLLMRPWIELGAVLQITASSLVGKAGPASAKRSWEFIDQDWVGLVASDSHDAVYRRPYLTDAYGLVRRRYGAAAANRLFVSNPGAITMGQHLTAEIVAAREGGTHE